MKAQGKTVKEILLNLPEDRLEPFNKLHDVIVKNLPKGFEPAISYGMWCRINFTPQAIIASPKSHCLLPGLPRKKDPSTFTIWGFMLIQNYLNGS